jgi:hypothetical protein
MADDDADGLVPFLDVRVLRSTPPALLCRIGDKSVWLPRLHISGKLWCAGDRGKLFIRRWVARDRGLIGPTPGTAILSLVPPRAPRDAPVQLQLVRAIRDVHHAG